MRVRMDKEERRTSILSAALLLSEATGYNALTREALSEVAGCSNALVTKVFGSMDALRDAIVAHAVEVENFIIIGQAIALRHPLTVKLPDELKEKAKKKLFPAH